MPSALSTVLFFSNYPPEKISRRSINSTPFRTAFLTILVSICIAHIFITKKFILTKENHIGKGTDESYNFSLNGLITTNSIVQWVESHIDQKEKILILPSGLIINYLARRQSPPIYGFHLFTQAIYGEIFLLEQLKKNSPPYIGIVTNIYNRFFGVYPWYGIHTRQWIEDNYIKVEQMGDSPFMQDDKAFGAIFYRRKY